MELRLPTSAKKARQARYCSVQARCRRVATSRTYARAGASRRACARVKWVPGTDAREAAIALAGYQPQQGGQQRVGTGGAPLMHPRLARGVRMAAAHAHLRVLVGYLVQADRAVALRCN